MGGWGGGIGSFTLVSSLPSKRPDRKAVAVLILYGLSTLPIFSLRPFELGMMAVATGLSSSSFTFLSSTFPLLSSQYSSDLFT